MKGKHIIKYFFISILLLMGLISIYNMFSSENYKKLRNIGIFRLNHANVLKAPDTEDTRHKYSGHRYKQRRPYNILGQHYKRN